MFGMLQLFCEGSAAPENAGSAFRAVPIQDDYQHDHPKLDGTLL